MNLYAEDGPDPTDPGPEPEPVEIPDFLRRAMEAHGVNPDEVAATAATLDLDAIEDSGADGEHLPADPAPEQIVMDLPAGEAARDQAIARVDAAADPDWKADAQRALNELIDAGEKFSADDIWLRVGYKPAEPRALGSLLQQAARRGRIVQTGERRKSARPEHHAYPCTVWRPLA